jgi:hypothetical protein
MQFAIAVPYTHLFLMTLVAYGLPEKLPEGKLVWDGQETAITKEVVGDKVVVQFSRVRYEFQGTKVAISSPVPLPNGQQGMAKGSYDLKQDFGIAEPAKWAAAQEVVLKRPTGQTVTFKLGRPEKSLNVDQTAGDAPGVFGFGEKKFPAATIRWK